MCCPAELIETCCCADDPIPVTLTAAVEIGGTPSGDVLLTHTSGTTWVGSGVVAGVNVTVTFSCGELPGGGCSWESVIVCPGTSVFVDLTTGECDPFEVNFFTANAFNVCFSGTIGVTVTP